MINIVDDNKSFSLPDLRSNIIDCPVCFNTHVRDLPDEEISAKKEIKC